MQFRFATFSPAGGAEPPQIEVWTDGSVQSPRPTADSLTDYLRRKIAANFRKRNHIAGSLYRRADLRADIAALRELTAAPQNPPGWSDVDGITLPSVDSWAE